MQRTESPVTPPVVLTIAGSDSGGGAGIQADLKTIEAGGAFGTSAITSVTAQNTTGVQGSHLLPTDDIAAQIRAVREDFDVAAVKTGMLATSEVIELVAERAADLPNLVVDPVMVATSGDRLLAAEAEDAYEALIAEAAAVTPNADEAEVLTGRAIDGPEDAAAAGRDLVAMGADAALVKGGHVAGDDIADVLVTADAVRTYRHDRVDTDATHGSGCTLSAAIATRLARGDDLNDAVASGIGLLARAVRYNLDVGEGPGSVQHTVELRDRAAREETSEAVESVAAALTELKLAPLVPEPGMAVAGATPTRSVPTRSPRSTGASHRRWPGRGRTTASASARSRNWPEVCWRCGKGTPRVGSRSPAGCPTTSGPHWTPSRARSRRWPTVSARRRPRPKRWSSRRSTGATTSRSPSSTPARSAWRGK